MKKCTCVLTRGYTHLNDYKKLIERNISIVKFINFFMGCEHLIFHEGNILLEHQKYVQDKTIELKLKFIDVKNTEPKTAFNDNNNKINCELCPPNDYSNSFSLGYKHMCHFWFMDFLDYTKEYKYIFRIDEDCILKNINKNIFNEMKINKKIFCSPNYCKKRDKDCVIIGLNKLMNIFLKENKLKRKCSKIRSPYTNIMIIDVEYIRKNKIVNKFIKKVNNSYCIYSNRWGDLPLWGVILNFLINKKLYYCDRSIKYYHGSHELKINYK